MIKFINGQQVDLSTLEKNELHEKQAAYADIQCQLLADNVRFERNTLLAATDWAVCRALETGSEFQELKTYRQALRDLPAQEGFPSDIVWPVAPKV